MTRVPILCQAGAFNVLVDQCMYKMKIHTFCAATYLEKQSHILVSLRTTKTVFQPFSSCQGDASCCRLYYQAAVGAFTFLSILFRVFLFAEGFFLTEGNSWLLVFPALPTRWFDKHTYKEARMSWLLLFVPALHTQLAECYVFDI